MEYIDENNLDELFEDSDDTTTEDETSLLHKIIQLRETSTNDYLYPITLIDAVKDINGVGINKIMNDKLIALQEILNDRIDITDQDVSLLRSSKVSAKESLLSSLAVYYLRGVSQLDLSTLYGSNLAKIYLSEEQPSISDSNPHYWINSTDKSDIKYYDGTSYTSVGQDIEVFIYSTLSDYLSTNGSITLYTSTSSPTTSSIYNTGDVYLYIGDESNIPYMYLSNRWVSMISSISSNVSNLSIDPIVNLVSVRYLTVSYSNTSPSSTYDIWYDGERAYIRNVSTDEFNDPVSYSLDKFIGSIFKDRGVGSTSKIFVGPATPRDNTSRYDVWVNTRSNTICINTSASNVPKWVEQTTLTDSITTLSIGNIFTNSDTLDDTRYIDYGSNNPIIGASFSLGIRNLRSRLINANTSISQIVYVMSNTLYTISVDADHEVDIALDNGEVLESGSVASPYTGYTRYYKTVYFNTGISSNTARVVVGSSDTRVATLCMKRGSNHTWVPNLSDIYSLLTDLIDEKVATSNIYIGGSPTNGSYNISTDLSYENVKMYYRSTWNDILDVSDIISAIQEIASIYDSTGVCTVTTSHVSPSSPAIGDVWINDNLIAMRWVGSSWGNTSSIMMSSYRTLYGTVQELSDTQLKLAFAQTSQEIDDVVDQASAINQNIQVFKQDDTPTGIINAGDLWVTQTGVKRLYRWNGTAWTLSGITRLMDIEADASGLHITIGGTPGTLGAAVNTAMTDASNANTTADHANTTAQNAYDLIDASTRVLTLDLSNDSVQIPTLYDGSGANYTNAKTTISVYYRGENVSNSATISVSSTSTGITYSYLNRVLTVSNMTSDTGYVELSATYSGLSSTIRFNLYKIKGGQPGSTGINGLTSYTFIRYSDYSDGMHDGQPSFDTDPSRPYIGIAVILDSSDLLPQGPSAPTEATSYKWSLYKGTDGSNGVSNAILYLYKRATTAPSIDWTDTLTYTFETRTLSSVPSGWSTEIPTGTNPLYVTAATARGRDSTDTIAYTEWSTPTLISSIGSDGLNSATILLYQRSDNVPSKPSGSLTYTFSTGVLSGSSLGNWTKTIPHNNGNPLYVIQATAISSNSTDTIESSEWTTPVIYVEDGLPGSAGADAVVRFLEIGESVIRTSLDFTSYTPSSLTFYAKQSSGSGTPTSLSAYYKVGYSTDGNTYTYDSIIGPSSSITKTIPTGQGYRYIRCILYYDQAGTQQLDDEIITVVLDSEELVDQIEGVGDRVTSLNNTVDGLSGRVNTTETNLYTLNNTITDQVLAANNPDSLISRVAALDASFEEIALTVSDNLADIGTITSRFSWEGLGLRISSILSSGESSVLTDVNSMYIHLRYSAVGTSSTGSQMVYGMSNKPTSRSQSLGIALTSTSQAPTNRENYKWVSLSGDVGAISVKVDGTGTTYQIYRRYSNNSDGSNPTYQATGTTYIGLKIGESGTEYWLQYRDVSSPISTYYTSDGIHFMKRDVTEIEVGSVTSDGFRLKNGIIEDGGFLRMGNYLWRPMVDKSLSFLYSPESSN